jgi:hypothetical protein
MNIPEKHATISEARKIGEEAGRETGKKASQEHWDNFAEMPDAYKATRPGAGDAAATRLEITAGPRWGILSGNQVEGTPTGLIGNLAVHLPIGDSNKWHWELGTRLSVEKRDMEFQFPSRLETVERSTTTVQGAPAITYSPLALLNLRGRVGAGLTYISEDGLATRQDATTGIVYGQEPYRFSTISVSPELGVNFRFWNAITAGAAVGADLYLSAPGQPGDRDDKRFINPYVWVGGGVDTNL